MKATSKAAANMHKAKSTAVDSLAVHKAGTGAIVEELSTQQEWEPLG